MIDAVTNVAKRDLVGLRAPGKVLPPIPSREQLRHAILRTVVYADLFEHALTKDEIRRYLIGYAASSDAVTMALDRDDELRNDVRQSGDCFHLKSREQLAERRRERRVASSRLWPVAQRYGRWIGRLPFTRLVGVTGALAMNNAGPDDDIDLFILVRPGRLWLCRLFVIAIVKIAARRGWVLCPNFLLSTDHLVLTERNLYIAHEVVQMVPLKPSRWHQEFLEANAWVRQFLPNAYEERLQQRPPSATPRLAVGPAEWLLATRLFSPLERWEMKRKIRRLSARLEREGGSTGFSPYECRGHFAGHDARVLAAYRERLAEFSDVL
jgi:hypothetical protein